MKGQVEEKERPKQSPEELAEADRLAREGAGERADERQLFVRKSCRDSEVLGPAIFTLVSTVLGVARLMLDEDDPSQRYLMAFGAVTIMISSIVEWITTV